MATTLYHEARNPGRVACQNHKGFSVDQKLSTDELLVEGNYIQVEDQLIWSEDAIYIATCEDCGNIDDRTPTETHTLS